MPDEKPLPLPLTGAEVKEAIMFKVEESLNKTCHLKDDNAYTSFRGKITINLALSDYGREQQDNHIVEVGLKSGLVDDNRHTVETTTEIEPAPPNQVRVDTNQGVPVRTQEKGKQVIRHVKYAARKAKNSESKIGQEKENA